MIALTTWIGTLVSAGKKKRMLIYSEMYDFNEQQLLNLKYNRKPVESIAEKFKFVPSILKCENLPGGEDGQILREYAENLGKTDAMSQIDYLNEKRATLTKFRDESSSDYKKYSSLYIKIFFMVGVLLAVLLA